MLQAMRERVQGIIATVIIVVLCLAFALWGIQYYLRDHRGSDSVATVNGAKISHAQLQTAYDRAKQSLMVQTRGNLVLTQDTQELLKKNILQQMINTQIIAQEADKLNLAISQEQINSVLTSIPAFLVNGQFSPGQFQETLSRMLYSENEFLDELKQKMLAGQLQLGIASTNFVLPNEVANSVKLIKQQRDISYGVIPLSKFKDSIKITDADIEKFYQDNKQQFAQPEQVSISYVELTTDNVKDQVRYTKEDLQKFYNDNLSSFSHPKRWQIVAALVPVAKDAGAKDIKQAEQAAAAITKQPKTGLGSAVPAWVSSDQMVDGLASEVAKLKIGEVSNPIKTQAGFYVIKVLRVKEAETVSFANAQDQVRKAYTQQKLNQLFDDAAQKLSDLTYTNSNSLEPAAKELGLAIKTTGLFTRDGAKSGLLANQKIVAAAFNPTVLQQNYNSDSIEISPGEMIVLRIKDHKPQTLVPLAEVKSAIARELYDQAAYKKVQELGNKMVQDLRAGASFAQVLNAQGLTIKSAARVDFQNKALDPQLVKAALFLALPSDKPSYGGAMLDNGGFAVIAVNKVYPGDITKLSSAQAQSLRTALEVSNGRNDFEILVKEATNKSKIKVNK